MKAKGSNIKRRVIAIVTAMVTTFLVSGGIPAFAHPLEDSAHGNPGPAAPAVTADATGGGRSWIIALIVVAGVLALAAALFATVRIYRTRARAVAAGA